MLSTALAGIFLYNFFKENKSIQSYGCQFQPEKLLEISRQCLLTILGGISPRIYGIPAYSAF